MRPHNSTQKKMDFGADTQVEPKPHQRASAIIRDNTENIVGKFSKNCVNKILHNYLDFPSSGQYSCFLVVILFDKIFLTDDLAELLVHGASWFVYARSHLSHAPHYIDTLYTFTLYRRVEFGLETVEFG